MEESQPREIATRDSWKHQPMPEAHQKFELNREFSPEEYQGLAAGLIPHEMEDKWFIFLENDWLYFHRSWTGICIYQLRLQPQANGYTVAEAWVNRDANQYTQSSSDAEFEQRLLAFLIDNFLLGKDEPFPVPGNQANSTPVGVFQHHMVGRGYPEVSIEPKAGND